MFFFKFPLPCDVVNVIQQVHVEALVDVFFFFLKSFLYMSYMAAKRLIQDFVWIQKIIFSYAQFLHSLVFFFVCFLCLFVCFLPNFNIFAGFFMLLAFAWSKVRELAEPKL